MSCARPRRLRPTLGNRGAHFIRPQLEPLEERQLLDANAGPTPTGLTSAYIVGLYKDLLERTPSTSEVNQWLTSPSASMTPLQVAVAFTQSPEYEADQIKMAYQHLLGRTPGAAEVSYWQAYMHNGMDTSQLTAYILGSDEFYTLSGGTPTGWLNAVYQDVLGRPPDASARPIGNIGSDFSARLSQATNILNSAEGHKDTINAVYEQLLDHPADEVSVLYWTTLMADGLTDIQLTDLVASSPEFLALQASLYPAPVTPAPIPLAAPMNQNSSSGPTAHLAGSSSSPASGPTLSIAGNPAPPANLPLTNTWTSVGPAPIPNGQVADNNPVSGRVTGIAPDPTNASIIYLATAGGGVWKTSDGGTSWTPLTDNVKDSKGNPVVEFMGAIAVAPSADNVIYAATGESNNVQDSYYGEGILVSTDNGATWKLETDSGAFNRLAFSKIVVDPKNSDIVYAAATDNAANGVTGTTGIYKSTDGGVTWKNTTSGISTTDQYSDLVIDPSTADSTGGDTLYCAVGTPGGATANGVYKSTDSGGSWALSDTGITAGTNAGNIKLAISASSTGTLYAAVTDNSMGGSLSGIYETTNAGSSWTKVATPGTNITDYMNGSGNYASTIAVDPSSSTIVYVGGSFNGTSGGNFTNQVLESTNSGSNWTDISNNTDGKDGVHADHHAMAFLRGGQLLDGNDGGIWELSINNITTPNIVWTDLNGNLATLQFYSIGLDPSNSNIMYGGTQDNGTNRMDPLSVWSQIQGGDSGTVAVDPTNPNTVYHTFFRTNTGANNDASDFIERSTNATAGTVTWTNITPSGSTSDNSEFYPPFVMDPNDSSHLILGTDHVYETFNGGTSWTKIGTPGSNGFSISTANKEDVTAVAIAPSDPNTIYVATAKTLVGGSAHVFVTTNDGGSWTQIDIPNITDHIQDLVVDPTDSKTVYAVRDRFDSGTAVGKVFMSSNGGTNWKNITNNLPNLPAYSLAIDTTDNALFVGNDTGVYATTNGGTSWSTFGTGLPQAQSRSLEYSSTLGLLADGTHGRSVWEISTTPMSSGGGGGGGGSGGSGRGSGVLGKGVSGLTLISTPSNNVTNQIRIFYPFRYTYDPQTGTYVGNLTLLNLEPYTLAGKAVTVALPQLPPGVTLANATAQLSTGPLAIVLPGASLQPGVALRVQIQLSNPLGDPLSTFCIGFPVEVFIG